MKDWRVWPAEWPPVRWLASVRGCRVRRELVLPVWVHSAQCLQVLYRVRRAFRLELQGLQVRQEHRQVA
jgi:hypothetical protein